MWEQLIWGALLPGAISAAIWAYCIKPWKRDAVPRAGGSLAIAMGYIFGHVAIEAPYVGGDVVAWLPFFAVFGAALGIIEFTIEFTMAKHAAAIIIIKLAVSFLLAFAILYLLPALRDGESGVFLITLAATAILSFMVWFAAARFAESVSGPIPGFYLWLCAAGSAGIILQSGNAKLAQLLGACAAGVAPSAICGFFSKAPLHSRGSTATFFIIYNSAITIALFFGDLPKMSAVFMGAAPAAGFVIFPVMLKYRGASHAHPRWTYAAGFLSIAAMLGAAYALLPKSEPTGY
ncbi:MAG: hypothetical protein ACKVS6_16075 [Planctomycetota bacterium]